MKTRNTIQRAAVKAAVSALGHATADEVFEYVHSSYPSISRATVYRNLNFLADSGELAEIKITGGANIYDMTTVPHFHIKCSVCGKIADADLGLSESLITLVKDTHGFDIRSCEVLFTGLCPECKL